MRILPLLLACALASCKTAAPPAPPALRPILAPNGLVPAADVAAVDAHFKAHKTNSLLLPPAQLPPITAANSFIVVDLDAQRAYFYAQSTLAAATSIASGRKYFRTETGDYTVGQKDLLHRSSSYGDFISPSGKTLLRDVQNGFDPTPPGAHFQGALMKHFLRFHHQGHPTAMGFHRGDLPGYPASHGCVRLPAKMAAWFYDQAPRGTPIYVRGSKNGVPFGSSQNRPKRSPKIHSSLQKPAPEPAEPAPAEPAPAQAEPPAPEPPPADAPPPEPTPALDPAPSADP